MHWPFMPSWLPCEQARWRSAQGLALSSGLLAHSFHATKVIPLYGSIGGDWLITQAPYVYLQERDE